jgi:hypothetical protein
MRKFTANKLQYINSDNLWGAANAFLLTTPEDQQYQTMDEREIFHAIKDEATQRLLYLLSENKETE